MRPFLATTSFIVGALILTGCSTTGLNQTSSPSGQVVAPPGEASPVETSPPAELADLPQSPKSYRSAFTIAEIAPTPAGVTSKTDAVIEATDNQTVYKFTGKTDYSLPPMSQAQMSAATSGGGATVSMVSNNWGVGARHTINGKINIKGYTLISDPDDALVFVMTSKGYAYQKGRGIVMLPTSERVFLGRPPSKKTH